MGPESPGKRDGLSRSRAPGCYSIIPYLDVLDASQVLLEARLQYTAALSALAQARIDVDRLLGKTSLPSTSSIR